MMLDEDAVKITISNAEFFNMEIAALQIRWLINDYLSHARNKQSDTWTDENEASFRNNHPYVGNGGSITEVPVHSIYNGIDLPIDKPTQKL